MGLRKIEYKVKITYLSLDDIMDEIEQMDRKKRIKIAKGIWGL